MITILFFENISVFYTKTQFIIGYFSFNECGLEGWCVIVIGCTQSNFITTLHTMHPTLPIDFLFGVLHTAWQTYLIDAELQLTCGSTTRCGIVNTSGLQDCHRRHMRECLAAAPPMHPGPRLLPCWMPVLAGRLVLVQETWEPIFVTVLSIDHPRHLPLHHSTMWIDNST